MTLDINLSLIFQGLIVAGLLGTAKVLWNTVVELAKLGVQVDDHGRRLGVLEEKP